MHDLEACLNSPEGLEHKQQGIDISMGGKPFILIAEVENIDFFHTFQLGKIEQKAGYRFILFHQEQQ